MGEGIGLKGLIRSVEQEVKQEVRFFQLQQQNQALNFNGRMLDPAVLPPKIACGSKILLQPSWPKARG
jgi:hypothetical protein